MKDKKVLVSGCYDLIHGGHITFFKTASAYGKVYVSIGSDENLLKLKGKKPYFSQDERLFIVNSIRYVEEAFIASGSGILDFEPDIGRINPDVFVVNRDGHTEEKEALCKKYGIEYKILERIPEPGLPARSSSATKRSMRFPYRLCLAGGWLDQPWVSEIHPGSVVVAQIWPDFDFNDRSGLATSSRSVGIQIWGDRYPEGDHEINAKLLFGAENPPDKKYISGSQDHIGLLYPGISRLDYSGGFWPERIESVAGKDICDWLSGVLHLVPLKPRPEGYDPLKIMNLNKSWVRELGEAGELCWEGVTGKNVEKLGRGLTNTLLSWRKILPLTVPDQVLNELETEYFPYYPGATTTGSGGGYVIVVSEKEVDGAVKIRIRY